MVLVPMIRSTWFENEKLETSFETKLLHETGTWRRVLLAKASKTRTNMG